MSAARVRRALGFVVRLLLTLFGAAIVLWNVELGTLGALMRSARPGWLIAGVALYALTGVLIGVRWAVLLRSDDTHLSLGHVVRITLESLFIGLVLPTGGGGDLYRIARMQGPQGGVTRASVTLVVDRLCGLWALCGLAIFASASPALPADVAVAVAVLCVLVLGASLISLHPRTLRLIERVARRFGLVRTATLLQQASDLLRRHLRASVLAAALSLSLFQHLVAVFALWCFTVAIRAPVAAFVLLCVAPASWLVGMVPSLGGFGLREGALSVMLQRSGVEASAASAIVLLSVVAILVRAGVGGVLLPLPSTRR